VSEALKVSVIVPLFNERESVAELVESIGTTLASAEMSFELIMVDDGSTDGTIDLLCELQKTTPFMRILQLRRNFGQTAAMAAGFDYARGEVIVPLDGDLQNDPADIPRMVHKLHEGYDVVSGWRRNRQDNLLNRKIPSWIANFIIGKITGVQLHDYGCTLKAYRRDVVEHLKLYGEMHRFIPALAKWSGARVTEMVVNHRPRIHGQTKYGLTRSVKVILDLITVKFLGSFSTKPLHIFGGVGLLSLLAAWVCGGVVVYQKLFQRMDMTGNPLFLLTVIFIMTSVQFLLMGLLAEMLARTYHESQNKPTYILRQVFESKEYRQDNGG